MRRYKLNRLFRKFPCLNQLGLSKKELENARIKVNRIDDALRAARATYTEEGDGVHTDLRFEHRRFCGFLNAKPTVRGTHVIGMKVLRADERGLYSETQHTVADMLHAGQSTIVVEVVTKKENSLR